MPLEAADIAQIKDLFSSLLAPVTQGLENASKTINHLAAQARQATETPTAPQTPTPAQPAAPTTQPAKTPQELRKVARQEAALIAARQQYSATGGKTGKDGDTFFKYFLNDYAVRSENGNVLAVSLDEDGNETGDAKPFTEVLTSAKSTPIYSGFFAAPKPNSGAINNGTGGYANATPQVGVPRDESGRVDPLALAKRNLGK